MKRNNFRSAISAITMFSESKPCLGLSRSELHIRSDSTLSISRGFACSPTSEQRQENPKNVSEEEQEKQENTLNHGEGAEVNEEEDDGEFVNKETGEIGGPRGPEPTRYGDWEQRGRCSDF